MSWSHHRRLRHATVGRATGLTVEGGPVSAPTRTRHGRMPVDPDVPAPRPVLRRALGGLRRRWDILLVIAAGGALGSTARYGLTVALPHRLDEIPWATVTVNVMGCYLLGVLMVFVTDVWPPQRYIRPFVGVGVMGGLTTFSTYTMDTWALVSHGHNAAGALYLLGSLAGGLAAIWAGLVSARVLAQRGRRQFEAPLSRHHSTDTSRSSP